MATKRHDYDTLPWSNILRRVWFFRQLDEPENDFWKRAGVDKHKRSKWYNHVNPSPSIETVNAIVNSLGLDRERDHAKILWLTYGDEPFTPVPVPLSPWRRLNPKEFVDEYISAAKQVYEKRREMTEDEILATLAQGFQVGRIRAAMTWQPDLKGSAGSDSAIFSGDSETALAEMLKQIRISETDFAFYESHGELAWLEEHLTKIQGKGKEYLESQTNYRRFFDVGLWDHLGKRVVTAVCEGIAPMIESGAENLTELLDEAISREFANIRTEIFFDDEFTPGPGLVWTEESTIVDEESEENVYVSKLTVNPANGPQAGKLTREVETRYSFKKQWLTSLAGELTSVCLVQVTGDSMSNTLGDGDLVLVDTQRTEPANNKIFAVRYDNQLIVRRFRITKRGVFLVSDNQAKKEDGTYLYPSKKLTEKIRIVGQVIWSARTFI